MMLRKYLQTMFKKKDIGKNLFKLFVQIEKRRRFIISTILLTVLMIVSTYFSFEEASFFVVPIIVLVYFFTYFSILEGITKKEWLTLFIPPLYFSVVFYLFYFFLPQRWLARAPFAVLYSVSIYALLLTQNIFNVGVEKSLQLFRAAFSINYLFLTLTMFLATSLLFSLRLLFAVNSVLIFIMSLPLALHFVWSINPQEHIERSVWKHAVVVSVILAQAVLVFSFVPITPSVFSLIVTALFYSLCGLLSAHLTSRLFRERIREYLFVLGAVFVITLLTVKW